MKKKILKWYFSLSERKPLLAAYLLWPTIYIFAFSLYRTSAFMHKLMSGSNIYHSRQGYEINVDGFFATYIGPAIFAIGICFCIYRLFVNQKILNDLRKK